MTSALPLLVESALKSSVLLVLAGAATFALRRSSAAVRHAVWTTSIAGVLLVAPLALILPALRVQAPGAVTGALTRLATPPRPPADAPPPRSIAAPPGRPEPAQAAPASPGSLPQTLAVLCLAGTAVFSSWLLAGALHLARIARQSVAACEPAIDELAASVAGDLGVPSARVKLRWTGREVTPMTWGLRRPVLILPDVCKTWDEERLRHVLVHEIGHIQRWDVLTQALSNAACAVYWFNPLVWMAARRMLVERERACDDLVLQSGAKPSAYAHGLLEIARSLGARWTAAHVSPAMARRSQVSGRLLAVLDPDRSRQGLGRGVSLFAALAGAAVILPLSVLQPVPAMQAALGPAPHAVATYSTPVDADARQAIAAVYEEWKSAIRRRDARAVSLLYTADGTVVRPALDSVTGHEALQNLYQFYLDHGLTAVEIHTEELYPAGDMICELGTTEGLGELGRVLTASHYMTLWKKEDGKWRVHRDFFNQ